MEFTETTPRGEHLVHGVAVSVPYIFAEGDTLSADGALYLNKAIGGNITNVLGTAARKWAETENEARKDKKHPAHGVEAKPAHYPLQAELEARFAAYSLSGFNRTSAATDPVAKFATSIAGEKVKELYHAKGYKFTDMRAAPDEVHGNVFNKHVAQYIAANSWVSDLAKSQVEAMKSNSVELELGPKPAPAPAPVTKAA